MFGGGAERGGGGVGGEGGGGRGRGAGGARGGGEDIAHCNQRQPTNVIFHLAISCLEEVEEEGEEDKMYMRKSFCHHLCRSQYTSGVYYDEFGEMSKRRFCARVGTNSELLCFL